MNHPEQGVFTPRKNKKSPAIMQGFPFKNLPVFQYLKTASVQYVLSRVYGYPVYEDGVMEVRPG